MYVEKSSFKRIARQFQELDEYFADKLDRALTTDVDELEALALEVEVDGYLKFAGKIREAQTKMRDHWWL